MVSRIVAMLLSVMLTATVAVAQSRSIFDLPSGRAVSAVVMVGEGSPPDPLPGTAMERSLAGVLAELKGRELSELRAAAPASARTADAAGAQQWCIIHLSSAREHKRVALLRRGDAFLALEIDPDRGQPPRRVELRRDAIAALYYSWPMYRGGFDPAAVSDPRAHVFKINEGLIPGPFILDNLTVGERILGGGRPSNDPIVRDLSTESLSIRLPRGYDPRSPAGLLVWVDAGDAGTPPAVLAPILDEMNLIAVGAAHSGNRRNLYSRIQLALDGVATASHRYHIDPARVYISGISGGGRTASIAQVCFPDVFMGCVPIVGMSCYQNVPNGLGQYYRAAFRKPGSAIFSISRQRRIAPMSARKDANLVEMQNAADIMKRDGISVRFFEDPKRGHEMPAEADLREALAWIEEPAAKSRSQRESAAEASLRSAPAEARTLTPAERAALQKAVEVAPWSNAAWRALDLLGRSGVSPSDAAR